MFNVRMLCAGHGDCLVVEYGNEGSKKRILIDAGTPSTYESSLLPYVERVISEEGACVFELFVITHVDDDHIGGSLRFLDEIDTSAVKIKEIWFNGYFHLSNQTPSLLGPKQGEQLTELIRRGGWPWNKRFKRYAVMVPDEGGLPAFKFSGMKLTILSPTFEKLQKLKPKWTAVIREEGLVSGEAFAKEKTVIKGGFLGEKIEALAKAKFTQDKAEANGSSIAFLADYEGKRVLFGADAHPSVLIDSLQRVPLNGACRLDAFKLPHHGSRNNVSTDMLLAFPAKHYLVSTNGAQFEHPDEEAIARVVVCDTGQSKELHFNYETKFNKGWKSMSRRKKYKYEARYGTGQEGLLVEI